MVSTIWLATQILRPGKFAARPWSQHQHPRQVSHQQSSGGAPASSSTAQASSAQGGRRARERVAGDAPVRRHAAAQPNLCALAATPHTARLPPLAAAEAHSYPHNRGLPGVEPEQPNPPKETASSAGPSTPARRRSYPRASPPTQHPHQLQQSRATRAGSPSFPSRPALPHQHHAQPRRQIALFAKSAAAACMGVHGCRRCLR